MAAESPNIACDLAIQENVSCSKANDMKETKAMPKSFSFEGASSKSSELLTLSSNECSLVMQTLESASCDTSESSPSSPCGIRPLTERTVNSSGLFTTPDKDYEKPVP